MTSPSPEREARYLWPDDLLRHGGELFHCRKVTVSPDIVEVEADRIVKGKIRSREQFRFAPEELVRVPATPPSADNAKAAVLFTT